MWLVQELQEFILKILYCVKVFQIVTALAGTVNPMYPKYAYILHHFKQHYSPYIWRKQHRYSILTCIKSTDAYYHHDQSAYEIYQHKALYGYTGYVIWLKHTKILSFIQNLHVKIFHNIMPFLQEIWRQSRFCLTIPITTIRGCHPYNGFLILG